MKSFLTKSLLVAAPFIAAIAIELFVLPIDCFCFRIWEALYIAQVKGLPDGRFYPNMTVAKREQGDLAPYSPYAVHKDVVWHTDDFGFRNKGTGHEYYTSVIVGDSAVLGTSMTQSNMLNEVLERRMGELVYPYAPFDMNKFVSDARFHVRPPHTVILCIMERGVRFLPRLKVPRDDAPPYPSWKQFIKNNSACNQALILSDRFLKMAMLHYMRGRLQDNVLVQLGYSTIRRPRVGRMLFFEGATANLPLPDAVLNESIEVLRDYRDYFTKRDIRFVFVPIPNKENVYYDTLPGGLRATLLDQLIPAGRAAGIETVDLQTPFGEARQRGMKLFHDDDSHWNENSVTLAAEKIAEHLTDVDSVSGPGK